MEDSYQWLEDEIAEVKTRKYFCIDGPASEELRQAVEEFGDRFPESYKQFVLRFGNAKLYRLRGAYELGVLAGPRQWQSKDGQELLEIGHYSEWRAFFKDSLLVDGSESPVFESTTSGLRRVADGFYSWLRMRSKAIRKRIGKRRWAEIVNGPKPFTEKEMEVVRARRLFKWKVMGTTQDNDLIFVVTNNSCRVLPYLSVGVRAKDGSLEGRVWLSVGDLKPGHAKRIQKDCYKRHVPPDALEVYSLPDPEPEDRDRYWEFQELSNNDQS